MSTTLAGLGGLVIVKTQITNKLSLPTSEGSKKSIRIHKKEKKLLLYLKEILTVEQIIDDLSIDDEDLLCFTNKDRFFMELENYSKYKIYFPGKYVHLVKCIPESKPIRWLVRCCEL